MTWLASYLWHGFYVGFFLGINGVFVVTVAWSMYESSVICERFESMFMGNAVTRFALLLMKHIAAAVLICCVIEHFWIKSWANCLILIENQGYRGIWLPLLVFLIFLIAPKKKRQKVD